MEGYYDKKIRNFATIGRISVNFIWILTLLSILNNFTNWFSEYDDIQEEYVENFKTIFMISLYTCFPMTGIIWLLRTNKSDNQ
ncbi:Uncharacterised protein [Sphingobacterium spiritivorum]|uniref:Uncharacterized protein n=1 Tax=Sphingobacterium spiritivorum ATCC 33861 TaxID=525373 RepID=D7VN85_SPHSI|nr:hypothetical protein HMPREF0766_12455 [Sphingobacterium spiritivorum ATCC 33861]SUJ21701.1 Uncharacterised protein [Sphingobacterium spiritivorum]